MIYKLELREKTCFRWEVYRVIQTDEPGHAYRLCILYGTIEIGDGGYLVRMVRRGERAVMFEAPDLVKDWPTAIGCFSPR